jgi:hypothetical protein
MKAIAHSVTLLTAENHILQKANKALSKHQRAKKTHVCQENTLTVENA